ncbi:MAG: pyrroloquinoline quinone biosynthesis protein PqqB [Pseudomonadota bacterium]
MRIIVLGAAAGGGVPQWNCGCANCGDARSGAISPMTQSAIAVSGDGERWLIVNASPDIRAQLSATPALWPRELRGSPIEAVLLTNGDVDHVAGLLTLREGTPFTLLATSEIHEAIAENPIFSVMRPALVPREAIEIGAAFTVAGLEVEAFSVPGKVPLYKEAGEVKTDEIGEKTIGLRLSAGGATAIYAPGCALVTDDLRARAAAADLLLFDGTVWENAEMPNQGVGPKTGRRMGHVPIAGDGGSMNAFAGAGCDKVYVHINNTNPILQPDGPERAALAAAGWGVAFDGMEISL